MFLLMLTSATWGGPISRVVRVFDFEERRLGNTEPLPMHWTKRQGVGFPHYVNGRLSTARSRSGQYSFQFDLNGGSLLYAYEPGRIPIVPGARYSVEVWVQTTDLRHARARLAVQVVDQDGRVVPDSRFESQAFASSAADPDWTRLHVEFEARDPSSSSAILELGLLQPEAHVRTSLGARALFAQDIQGSAWFDDLSITQVPSLAVSVAAPGNVFAAGEPIDLTLAVRDRVLHDLSARVAVTDAAGNVLHQHTTSLTKPATSDGGCTVTLRMPELPPGGYSAEVALEASTLVLACERVAFVTLPGERTGLAPDRRLCLVATGLGPEAWGELPELASLLGAGTVKIGIAMGEGQSSNLPRLHALLSELRERRIEAVGVIGPPRLRVDGRDLPLSWSSILDAPVEAWKPDLESLIARHAPLLRSWQLGQDSDDQFALDPRAREAFLRVRAEFLRLTNGPVLAMPWPSWLEPPEGGADSLLVRVAPSVLPGQIPLYLKDFPAGESRRIALSLTTLPVGKYGSDEHVRDLVRRVVHALAAGADRIDIEAPRVAGAGAADSARVLLAVRNLSQAVGNARFVGQLPLGTGIEAFLFDRGGSGVVLLWSNAPAAQVMHLPLTLGRNPVQVSLSGVVTPLAAAPPALASENLAAQVADVRDNPAGYQPAPQRRLEPPPVTVEVGADPIILMDVEGDLAWWRASVRLDRPLIEASYRGQHRVLEFRNTYGQSVSGQVRLEAPSGWRVSPQVWNFSLNADEVMRTELLLEIPYNSVAGEKQILATFDVQGDQPARFVVPVTVTLGLSDLGVQTVALRERDAILVQQFITNYGTTNADYHAFAQCTGQARQERTATNLAPGATTIKRYRFEAPAAGTEARVRAGVREADGLRVLNDEIVVP